MNNLSKTLTAMAALAVLIPGLGACGQAAATDASGSSSPTSLTPSASGQPTETKRLTIYAAASLTEPFEQIAVDFEAANPGVETVLSFDGSSTLVTQISEGAPADVFASADQANMDKATQAGLAGTPAVFTSNALTIAVPAGNPGDVTSLADLAKSDLRTVVCAEAVPCGALARQAATAAGIELKPVSEEQNVKAVLAKITSGEAEAGLVYVTDVLAAGDAVEQIELPTAVTTEYPVAVLTGAAEPGLAQAFIDYLVSAPAQAVLAERGFTSLG
ncbi:MAG: molybdate ABC transporter substrate-binding protein [Bifidobacteriaceae bacterium]|jgi:molybdate transport system substrate-binding protein|nr:molybdate ABC transporter substrate-binding protein [Bifidobacteriaceae bacterium]